MKCKTNNNCFPNKHFYRALIRPIMVYGCQVWNPHQHDNIDLLERVRFKGELLTGVVVVGGTPHSCHADVCLKELLWPTLLLHQQYLSILYNVFHKCYSPASVDYCTFIVSNKYMETYSRYNYYRLNPPLMHYDIPFCKCPFCGTLTYCHYQMLMNSPLSTIIFL